MTPSPELREWVETWKRAGAELEAIRKRELPRIDTQTAIRQIFGVADHFARLPKRMTSGLVEQQALFRKLGAK